MRLAAAVVACLALASPALAAPEHWSRLMSPQELAAVLARAPEVRVLHAGGGFARGHVPGATPATVSDVMGPPDNPGLPPTRERLAEVARGWGVTADTPVVVVPDGRGPGDFGAAARIYWTLKGLGVRDLAILNGGFAGWAAAGLPVASGPARARPSDWTPPAAAEPRVTVEELRRLLSDGPSVALIDARHPDQFRGRDRHPAAARPGTLPDAENLPFYDFFDGTRMRSAEEIRALVEAGDLDGAQPAVTFCNTGILAATAWFALSEVAGVPDVRLYPGSAVEWSRTGGPMENVPGRLTHYWRMFSGWLAGLLA